MDKGRKYLINNEPIIVTGASKSYKGNVMSKNIKVYSTPTCPYCHRAKQFLKDSNVPFEDIDVSKSQEKAQEMITKSGQMGVPVIDIDGKILVGFNKSELESAISS